MAQLDQPVLQLAGIAAGDNMLARRHHPLGEVGSERRLLRMIDVGVTLAEQVGGLPRRSRREAQNPDAVQILDDSLLSPPRNHGRHFDAPHRQLSSQQPGGSAIAPMLAPREDLHADEAELYQSAVISRQPSVVGGESWATRYRHH